MKTRSIVGAIVTALVVSALGSPRLMADDLSLIGGGGSVPDVLLNLSVEWPTGGAAYNDGDSGSGCNTTSYAYRGGNIGDCYSPTFNASGSPAGYIGYFDASKCYDYDSTNGYFKPIGNASNKFTSTMTCSGHWSGNFLNWATMTAIDEFRLSFTGGNRSTDNGPSDSPANVTVLRRANVDVGQGGLNAGGVFPLKAIGSADPSLAASGTWHAPTSNTVTPSTVAPSPYTTTKLYVYNYGDKIDVGTAITNSSGTPTADGNGHAIQMSANKNTYFVKVKVCDASNSPEYFCTAYGSNYKPTGLIQNNSTKMRFAVSSYLVDSNITRRGGVIRAKMGYLGPTLSDGTTNSNAEWDATTGVLTTNPHPSDAVTHVYGATTYSAVSNSGAVNYINKFAYNGMSTGTNYGVGGTKGYDPIGELFYEGLRYLKNSTGGAMPEYSSFSPTNTATSGTLTVATMDNFPVITTWTDPISSKCDKLFIVGINDSNPWLDKKLPGTAFPCQRLAEPYPRTGTCLASGGTDLQSIQGSQTDWGSPTYQDSDMKSFSYTNTSGTSVAAVGVEAMTNKVGDLEGLNGTSQAFGGTTGTWYNSANHTIPALGDIFGTFPLYSKSNSYYIAGMAYWAHVYGWTTDYGNTATVTTYLVDTQEYTTGVRLVGPMNMLWLAGKYGGFTDSDNSNTPNLTSEWSANGSTGPTLTASGAYATSGGSTTLVSYPDNYVLASNPQAMVTGLANAFKAILFNSAPNAFSAAALPTVQSKTDQIAFLATLFPESSASSRHTVWNGHMRAYLIDLTTGLPPLTVDGLPDQADPNNTNINTASPNTNSRRPLWDAGRVLGYTVGSSAYSSAGGSAITQLAALDSSSSTGVGAISVWPGRKMVFGIVPANGVPETRANFWVNDATPTSTPNWTTLKSDLGQSAGTDTHVKNLIHFVRGNRDGALADEFYSSNRNNLPSSMQYFYTDALNDQNLSSGTNPLASYEHALGDLFHSDPVIVGNPQNFAYETLNLNSYSTFVTKHSLRRRVIYVGANDGFLHAFDAGVYNRDTTNFAGTWDGGTGREIFAYSPRTSLASLNSTFYNSPSSSAYGGYFVDGPLASSDVFTDNSFGSGGAVAANRAWHTVLVAGERQGGSSIYALDVTQADKYASDHTINGGSSAYDKAPACLDGASGCSDGVHDSIEYPRVLWEKADSGMGQTWSRPAIGRIEVYDDTYNASNAGQRNNYHKCLGLATAGCEDKYIALVGGGYDSSFALGKALYMIDVETGTILWKGTSGKNGSGTTVNFDMMPAAPAVADVDDNGYLDIAYVGDYSGNLWRINLTPDTATLGTRGHLVSSALTYSPFELFSDWKLSGGVRVTSSQPFFMEPSIVLYKILSSGTKQLGVALGTGDRANLTSTTVAQQYFYFVIDPATETTTQYPDSMTALTATSACQSAADISSIGWKLQLSTTSEKTTTTALSEAGNLVFTTYVPTGESDTDCSPTGTSNIYRLAFATGNDPACDTANPTATPDRIYESGLTGSALGITQTITSSGDIMTVIEEQGGNLVKTTAPNRVSSQIRDWKEQ